MTQVLSSSMPSLEKNFKAKGNLTSTRKVRENTRYKLMFQYLYTPLVLHKIHRCYCSACPNFHGSACLEISQSYHSRARKYCAGYYVLAEVNCLEVLIAFSKP